MKGVILAAGNGSRLGPLTSTVPKALLEIAGRPLIDYTLDAMAAVGINDVVIVSGYLAQTLEDDLAQRDYGLSLTFIRNERFELQNGHSLSRARRSLGNDAFVLTMADHMLSAGLLERLVSHAAGQDAVAVDYSPKDMDAISEATRVLVNDENYVVAISKDLDPWNGLDAGAFYLTPRIFETMDDLPSDSQLSTICQRHIALGFPLRAADVTGSFWMDVDTVADYALAQTLMAANAQPIV